MSYESAPFWWIVCDEPECGAKSTEGSDYSAWGDQGGARDEALDSDWIEAKDGDLFFCSLHRDRVCGECERHVPGGVPEDYDGMCGECWAEDAKQNHGRKS
jgi:hypothetical protein